MSDNPKTTESVHPYHIVVNPHEWTQIQSLMEQQGVTEFTHLSELGKNILGDERWAVKEKAREAKAGCHITFDPPRTGQHIGRTQPRRPAPFTKP